MTRDEHKASKREFVTAVAAIMVGGVVSFSGVVVGCQTTRDAQADASRSVERAQRAERTRADLSELRSVLDRSAADLYKLEKASGGLAYLFEVHSSTQGTQAQDAAWDDIEAERKVVYSLWDEARADLLRMQIRLGSDYSLVELFELATAKLGGNMWQTPGGLPPRGGAVEGRHYDQGDIDAALKYGQIKREEFVEEARSLVGSQLPD